MEDFTRLWMRITWYVKGFPMRMFKWTPDFHPEKESPLTPVWIHFEGLPLYLFEEEPLLNRPLKIDHNNKSRVKLGQASVCVALDVSKEIKDQVWIGFAEEDTDRMIEGFWQPVHYDNYPYFCTDCCHLGHSLNECKRKKEQAVEGPVDVPVEQGKNEKGAQKLDKIPFRRVSMPEGRRELNKQKLNSTKEWVRKAFGSAQLDNLQKNSFAVLEHVEEEADNPPAEKREEGVDNPPAEKREEGVDNPLAEKRTEGVANPPAEKREGGVDNPPAEKREEGLDNPPAEKREEGVDNLLAEKRAEGVANPPAEKREGGNNPPLKKRACPSNILNASELAPPSMLTGFGLQAVQLSTSLADYSLDYKDNSAPPTPTGTHKVVEGDAMTMDQVGTFQEDQAIILKEGSLPFNE
ncbi:hypothetical protein LIER_39063 [Lithospermum erythrorhizon]|uniref:DUF4283 domain-containing protein n=1 Tax=Lithospermum erythrorhizon TaxID=34254 RepID=A0AAV3QBI4_LITER